MVLALFGASGVFGQLQDALNTICGVNPKPGGGVMSFLRARFLSLTMVGGVCFLLLASLTVETVLRGLSDCLKQVLPGGHILALALFLVFDLAVVVLLTYGTRVEPQEHAVKIEKIEKVLTNSQGCPRHNIL